MPPPRLNHATSTLLGIFPPSHMKKMRMTPRTKGKLRKLCAYLAASDHAEKALGPITGNRTDLPNVMLRPDKAHNIDPRAAGLDSHHTACEVENDQQCQHAQDGDGADPVEPHLVEPPPFAPHRLLDHIGFGVRDGTETLDAVQLPQELLLVYRISGRIDRGRLLGRERACDNRQHKDRHC